MRRFFALLFLLALPAGVEAVLPMSETVALVAGDGAPGFKDGDFTSAQFKFPSGLAVNPEGTRLYVADAGNNRIRVVRLDQNNQVETLTGQDAPGALNGPLAKALFNQPRRVVYLPGDRLIVQDAGNQTLRLVDLKTGLVSALEGKAPPPASAETPAPGNPGAPATLSLAGIRDMVYFPPTESLVFSQPDEGALKSLNLKTGVLSLVFKKRPECLHPTALCAVGDKLYVADRDLFQVCLVDWREGEDPRVQVMHKATSAVLALMGNERHLYAFLSDLEAPLVRILPAGEPVTFMSVWGDVITDPGQTFPPLSTEAPPNSLQFAMDPLDDGKMYIANPSNHILTSFRDPRGTRFTGETAEPEFPERKGPRTFRILLIGDSRSCEVINYQFRPMPYPYDRVPRPLGLPKRLELELNRLAALDDVPVKFEVMVKSHSADQNLFIWPAYEVPDLAAKYDVDLAILLQPPTPFNFFPFMNYYTHPITKEGIPARAIDPEYLLKPPMERVQPGEPRRFFDLCRTRKWVQVVGNSLVFSNQLKRDLYGLTVQKQTEPDLFDSLTKLLGKPLALLNQKLSLRKTSGGDPTRLLVCFTPTGAFRPCPEDADLWEGATRAFRLPFLDMSGEMKALRLSYFPIAERGGNDHFDINGHLFFGQLLAHDLIRDGYVPWRRDLQPSRNSRPFFQAGDPKIF